MVELKARKMGQYLPSHKKRRAVSCGESPKQL